MDTRVYVKNGRLKTDLHVKPSDTHQYLQADSCHPRHCKTAIPFVQTLHLHRICFEQDNLQKWCQELKHHLMKRGYDAQQLDSEIQRALDTPRETDLQSHNDQEKSARIPLVVTYHATLPSLGNNHQTTSKYPSYVGATTKGFPFTTVNCLSSPEKFEGALGQSRTNVKHREGTRELAL